MNSGGSPSGDSAPPILQTRKMKNTTTCALDRLASFARNSGRIRIMAAPVVPTMLAIKVPKASRKMFVAVVPRGLPVTRMPPATMKLIYSASAA